MHGLSTRKQITLTFTRGTALAAVPAYREERRDGWELFDVLSWQLDGDAVTARVVFSRSDEVVSRDLRLPA